MAKTDEPGSEKSGKKKKKAAAEAEQTALPTSTPKDKKPKDKKPKEAKAVEQATVAQPTVAAPTETQPVAAAPVEQSFAAQPIAPRQVVAPARKGRKGLVALILAELIALVAGLIVLAVLLFNIPLPWANGGVGASSTPVKVSLEAAAAVGSSPFSEVAYGAVINTEIAVPAMDALPDEATPLKVTQVPGSDDSIYGRNDSTTENFCQRDAIAEFLGSDSAAAEVWAQSLTSDATFAWTAGELTASTAADYVKQLTRYVLVNDTLVTLQGYSEGAAVPSTAVLQKGTWILIDERGVPRVKCNGASPLTVAEAASGSTTFVGAAWADFAADAVVAIAPADALLPSIAYRVPATPSGFVSRITGTWYLPVEPTEGFDCTAYDSAAGEVTESFVATNNTTDNVMVWIVDTQQNGCVLTELIALAPGNSYSLPLPDDVYTPYPGLTFVAASIDGTVVASRLIVPADQGVAVTWGIE